jgi:hypothetical protein
MVVRCSSARQVRARARGSHARRQADPAGDPAQLADDEPTPGAIYEVGVIANVLQLLKLPTAP